MKAIDKIFIIPTLASLAFIPPFAFGSNAAQGSINNTAQTQISQNKSNTMKLAYSRCVRWRTRCYTRRYCRRYYGGGCYVCRKYLRSTYRYHYYRRYNTCSYSRVRQLRYYGYSCYRTSGYYGSRCHYYYKRWCRRYCVGWRYY